MLKRNHAIRIANLILFTFGVLLFVYAEPAADAAFAALSACGSAVVPVLFPYMVLSDLIVRRHLLAPLAPLVPMRALFGLPPASAVPFLLGGLCGFPIGARTVCGLYREGALSKSEAERAIAVSNNTGPAFAVGVAGGRIFGDRGFGWYLYIAQLLSAVAVGVLMRRAVSRKPSEARIFDGTSEAPVRALLNAVTSAAWAVIPLAGYIVFFSVLSAILSAMLPETVGAAVGCVLELTGGIRMAASLGGAAGRFLAGFAVGFSGISVFVQAYSFTAEAGLSLRRTFFAKSLQGCLTGVLCLLYPL